MYELVKKYQLLYLTEDGGTDHYHIDKKFDTDIEAYEYLNNLLQNNEEGFSPGESFIVAPVLVVEIK